MSPGYSRSFFMNINASIINKLVTADNVPNVKNTTTSGNDK